MPNETGVNLVFSTSTNVFAIVFARCLNLPLLA